MALLTNIVGLIATILVVLATMPVIAGLYQFMMVGLSFFVSHLEQTAPCLPRVSILIPAWNEDAVIATTIDRLMKLNYPADRLRVYVIDDASSDQTPYLSIEKSKEYPGQVIHIRRVAGGEGKAHTLNYGLDVLWANDWTEAVLIMDADVIYTEDSLLKMARHFSDPSIGAVTAYIKEGSKAPNYVQRFITFEYITATGASRRAQNVMGFLACLSGGAQLHSRENLMAIGGQIFSATWAEDTFTTFWTQLRGRRAIFEPNALVYAEEPDDLVGLWKQRVRWARGNVQITGTFADLWANPDMHQGMGSLSMSFLWFSIFLMPVFQISAAVSLVGLFFLDPAWAWSLFRLFWLLAGIVYLVVTFVSYVVDFESARKSWLEGLLFPGVVSLLVMFHAFFPQPGQWLVLQLQLPDGHWLLTCITLFVYAWLGLSMAVAYSSKVLQQSPRWSKLAPPVLYFTGYGAFLCAVTFGSYVMDVRLRST